MIQLFVMAGLVPAVTSFAKGAQFHWLQLRQCPLKHRDVFQQRNHAEDDDDNARDLLGAAVDRQQVDQIENENNDEKRDQRADEHFEIPLETIVKARRSRPNARGAARFRTGNSGALDISVQNTPVKAAAAAGDDVKRASETLETQSQQLGSQVTQFLVRIRAA